MTSPVKPMVHPSLPMQLRSIAHGALAHGSSSQVACLQAANLIESQASRIAKLGAMLRELAEGANGHGCTCSGCEEADRKARLAIYFLDEPAHQPT